MCVKSRVVASSLYHRPKPTQDLPNKERAKNRAASAEVASCAARAGMSFFSGYNSPQGASKHIAALMQEREDYEQSIRSQAMRIQALELDLAAANEQVEVQTLIRCACAVSECLYQRCRSAALCLSHATLSLWLQREPCAATGRVEGAGGAAHPEAYQGSVSHATVVGSIARDADAGDGAIGQRSSRQ